MKKQFLIYALLSILFFNCNKEEIVETNLVKESNSSEQKISENKAIIQSIYFVDTYNCPPATLSIFPDEYSLDVSAWWQIENGKFVAYASSRGYVYDDYGDNCYSLAQVMLVKNDRIYGTYKTEVIRVDGFNEAEASTSIVKWYFPYTTDLADVYIVSQSAVWACMGSAPDLSHATINGAKDKRVKFNLVPPATLPSTPSNLAINDLTINLTWNASSYATIYRIYRSIDNGTFEFLASTTNTYYRDYSVIHLPDNQWFYYKVQAVNNSGSSGYSNIVSTQGTTYN